MRSSCAIVTINKMKYFGCNRSLSGSKASSYIRAVAAVNAPAQPPQTRIADQKSALHCHHHQQLGAAKSLSTSVPSQHRRHGAVLYNFIVSTKFRSKVNFLLAIPSDWCPNLEQRDYASLGNATKPFHIHPRHSELYHTNFDTFLTITNRSELSWTSTRTIHCYVPATRNEAGIFSTIT